MAVHGGVSGGTYKEEDIFDDAKYLKMRSEPLVNDDDEIVIPVRNKNRPHFRRLGKPSFGSRIGRGENNSTHDTCVNFLFDGLSSAKHIDISIYIFDENGKHQRQVIFSTLAGTKYCWFKEADARIAFRDGTYIQPDLGGRDVSKFFPRSNSPTILIEVIRTHAPELETFKKLYELSLANTMVVFYFVAEDKKISKLNNVPARSDAFEMRISHYMLNGDMYIGENVRYALDGRDIDEWHLMLSVSYFSKARGNA